MPGDLSAQATVTYLHPLELVIVHIAPVLELFLFRFPQLHYTRNASEMSAHWTREATARTRFCATTTGCTVCVVTNYLHTILGQITHRNVQSRARGSGIHGPARSGSSSELSSALTVVCTVLTVVCTAATPFVRSSTFSSVSTPCAAHALLTSPPLSLSRLCPGQGMGGHTCTKV